MRKIWLIAAALIVLAALLLPQQIEQKPISSNSLITEYKFNSIADCQKLDINGLKPNCYNTVAVKKLDISICEYNEDGLEKEFCYFNIAVRAGNSKLCQKISDEKLNQDCKYNT